jgi:hypothetical protein
LKRNVSAEGAKQRSPGGQPREKRSGETSPERAAQVFRFLTTSIAPAGLQLCQFLTFGSFRNAHGRRSLDLLGRVARLCGPYGNLQGFRGTDFSDQSDIGILTQDEAVFTLTGFIIYRYLVLSPLGIPENGWEIRV